MEKPTVILIGGAPLVRTNEVARTIARRWDCSCVGTEDLIQAIMGVTNAQSHPHFHLLQQKDHRQYFVTHTPARLATDAQYRHEAAWPAIKQVITYHLDESTGLVIEGWALLPDKVTQVKDPQVRSVWLTAPEEFFNQSVQQDDFFQRSPMENVLAQKFASRSILINDTLRRQALQLDFPIIETRPDEDIEDIVEKCCTALTS